MDVWLQSIISLHQVSLDTQVSGRFVYFSLLIKCF